MLNMESKLYFELPDNPEVAIEIVKAIPSDWCWVDGGLVAPKELYERGKIAEDTELVLSRFYSIKSTIISTKKSEGHLTFPVKLDEIFLEGKLPSSVYFDEAGFDKYSISIDMVKKIAVGYIQKGYKGWLRSFSGYRDNSKYDNPEDLSLNQFPERGGSFISPRPMPSHVVLAWDERHGGKRERLIPIISKLEQLGLKEFQLPKAS